MNHLIFLINILITSRTNSNNHLSQFLGISCFAFSFQCLPQKQNAINPIIPDSANNKNPRKSRNLNDLWYHPKVLLKRFYLNGHTIGFHRQTQKLELHYMSL